MQKLVQHIYAADGSDDINCPGFSTEQVKQLRRGSQTLDEFLFSWCHNNEMPFRHVAQHAPPSAHEPTYFQMMSFVERYFPIEEHAQKKHLMELALAEYYATIGIVVLTLMQRGFYGFPLVGDKLQCGGVRAFGHTDFREPPSFFKLLNPKMDLDWEPWKYE